MLNGPSIQSIADRDTITAQKARQSLTQPTPEETVSQTPVDNIDQDFTDFHFEGTLNKC